MSNNAVTAKNCMVAKLGPYGLVSPFKVGFGL